MAVRRSSGRPRRIVSRPSVRDRLPADRYDAILTVIPLSYALALAGHAAFDVSMAATLVPASLVGLALLFDAVYLNPPTGGDCGRAGGEPAGAADCEPADVVGGDSGGTADCDPESRTTAD